MKQTNILNTLTAILRTRSSRAAPSIPLEKTEESLYLFLRIILISSIDGHKYSILGRAIGHWIETSFWDKHQKLDRPWLASTSFHKQIRGINNDSSFSSLGYCLSGKVFNFVNH